MCQSWNMFIQWNTLSLWFVHLSIFKFIHNFQLLLIWLSHKTRKFGISSNGIIFCTWFLFVLTGIPEFYTWFQVGTNPTVNFEFIF